MREYFKTKTIPQEVKEFRDFCKKNGADFVDGEKTLIGVWIIPKRYGQLRLAISLNQSDGLTNIGTIDEGCQNFQNNTGQGFFKEELAWSRKIFEKLEKWNPSKPKTEASKD